MPVKLQIKRIGNSLGITIPSKVLKAHGLQAGDLLYFDPEAGSLHQGTELNQVVASIEELETVLRDIKANYRAAFEALDDR